MVRISSAFLLGFACLYIPVLAQESPAPKSELICSQNDPNDCYPRIFEPTKDFQDIREGQDIPPGLHVRLNVYTGTKEARLNIPIEGEEDSVTDSVPIEQAMVVVEAPETEEIKEVLDQVPEPQIPLHAPDYDTSGKVSPPPPDSQNPNDMTNFETAKLSIQMETRGFDVALDDLLELSHDIYYGVEIAKDFPVLERLICFTLGAGTERFPASEKGREHKAAGIISSAFQNNPTALKEIGDFWQIVVYPTCGVDLADSKNAKVKDFVSRLRNRLGKEKDPATLKAKVTAISNLIREPHIQANFLEKGGMELLLAIFLKKGEKWDMVKKKVGELVTDNFLDEELGADLGVWPRNRKASDEETCETKGKMLEDGCWEYHVSKFHEKSRQLWAGEFLELIKMRRAEIGKEDSQTGREREL